MVTFLLGWFIGTIIILILTGPGPGFWFNVAIYCLGSIIYIIKTHVERIK